MDKLPHLLVVNKMTGGPNKQQFLGLEYACPELPIMG